MTTPEKNTRNLFKAIPLELIHPTYESGLTDMIFSLERYRGDMPSISTPPAIFGEVRDIFHMLESVGSARIEGNRTTVLEFVETQLEKKPDPGPNIVEIRNMMMALAFIDENIESSAIDRALISQIHKIVVQDLGKPPAGEGSLSPGEYRTKEVGIENSELVVVPSGLVHVQMEELLAYIGKNDGPQFDLLKTAIAHHRFVWIHPFDNGNGRTVRLLTYAMLLKYGFGKATERLVNPVAIFCEDRNKYVAALGRADKGDKEGVLDWCSYMLSGLKREVERLSRLADYEYLKKNILLPAIASSLDRMILKPVEAEILKIAIEKKEIVNGDVTKELPLTTVGASKILADLREVKMLLPVPGNQRKYRISFNNNYLLREVMSALKEKGFWQD